MSPIYCIMFNASLNDDIRDLLFQMAYLMIKDSSKKRKVRSKFCEGIVTENGCFSLHGTNGVRFGAQLETEKGNIKVDYLVRPQDFHRLEGVEYGAWLSFEDILNPPENLEEKIRPNPIHKVAKSHQFN